VLRLTLTVKLTDLTQYCQQPPQAIGSNRPVWPAPVHSTAAEPIPALGGQRQSVVLVFLAQTGRFFQSRAVFAGRPAVQDVAA
jgi:hypothetical protein